VDAIHGEIRKETAGARAGLGSTRASIRQTHAELDGLAWRQFDHLIWPTDVFDDHLIDVSRAEQVEGAVWRDETDQRLVLPFQ